jgi:hypothetical protein
MARPVELIITGVHAAEGNVSGSTTENKEILFNFIHSGPSH